VVVVNEFYKIVDPRTFAISRKLVAFIAYSRRETDRLELALIGVRTRWRDARTRQLVR